MLFGTILGGFILLIGNKAATDNAHKTHQLNDEQYEIYRFRSVFGVWLFGGASALLGAFLSFMAFELKTNLTITAVPTPELIAEMKFYAQDENLKHREVEFNGEEQEITFYLSRPWKSGKNISLDKNEKPLLFKYGIADTPQIIPTGNLCFFTRTFDSKFREHNQALLEHADYKGFFIKDNTIYYPADELYTARSSRCFSRGTSHKYKEGGYKRYREAFNNLKDFQNTFMLQILTATMSSYSASPRLSMHTKIITSRNH